MDRAASGGFAMGDGTEAGLESPEEADATEGMYPKERLTEGFGKITELSSSEM